MRKPKTRRRRRTTHLRFPCGHLLGERATKRRMRTSGDRAVWVACARCNVIALAVA